MKYFFLMNIFLIDGFFSPDFAVIRVELRKFLIISHVLYVGTQFRLEVFFKLAPRQLRDFWKSLVSSRKWQKFLESRQSLSSSHEDCFIKATNTNFYLGHF